MASSSAALYTINLKYEIGTYTLIVGFKKINWNYDEGITPQSASVGKSSPTSTRFNIVLRANFGARLV
jgi:hypothetical protein